MQSNNTKMNTNDNDFKLVCKKGKKTVAAVIQTSKLVPVPNKPIISCEHCQRPGHKINKCLILEKLKTTECVYCHAMGHDNKNCPVSKANSEKKRIKAEQEQINIENNKKVYDETYPQVLTTKVLKPDPVPMKFAWTSVAIVNRDPIKLKKMEEEDIVAKKIDHDIRIKDNWKKKLLKKAAEKQLWLAIKPVVLAMKEAYPISWIYMLENTPYDTDQAINLRYKNRGNKGLVEEKYIPEFICVSCDELIEPGNQGIQCVYCIFQLGNIPI